MSPRTFCQCARCVQAVIRVPSGGQRTVGIGVEHEGAPARSRALVPVSERITVRPVFDGSLFILRAKHVRDAESRLLHVHIEVVLLCERHTHFHARRLRLAVYSRHAVSAHVAGGQRVRLLLRSQLGQHFRTQIHAVARQRQARLYRAVPRQHTVRNRRIARTVNPATLYDERNYRLIARILDVHSFHGQFERRFDALFVLEIVNHRHIIYMAASHSRPFRLDGEEILQRRVLVEFVAQVRQVVAELHRLIVELAVRPAA